MEWTEETILRLRAFWVEGLSTAEIGRRLAISKNAVVGKAHRLNLPPRPSPIRREGESGAGVHPRQPRRLVGPTLPPLGPHGPLPTAVAPAPLVGSPAASSGRKLPAEVPAPAVGAKPVAVGPAAPRSGRRMTCCWPIGEPGTKSFRFCDAEAAPGKPYCAEHARLAYVRVRDRREEAA